MWVGGEMHSTWNIVKLFEESRCPLHGDISRCPALSPERRGGIAPVIVLPHWHVYVFICILLGPYGSTVFNTFRCHQACNMTSQLFTEPTGSTCIMVLLFVLAAMATMPTHEMQKTGVFRGKSSVSSFCLFCGAMLWLQAIFSILKPWTQSRLGEVIDNWMCIQMKVGGYKSWWPNPGKEAAG